MHVAIVTQNYPIISREEKFTTKEIIEILTQLSSDDIDFSSWIGSYYKESFDKQVKNKKNWKRKNKKLTKNNFISRRFKLDLVGFHLTVYSNLEDNAIIFIESEDTVQDIHDLFNLAK